MSKATHPEVTVSIVNHESRDAVLKGLGTLLADRDRQSSLQVIVVDNASTDGSVREIQERYPQVEVIARKSRGGFGANHNLALAHARGEQMLLLNDDTRVLPGAIDTLSAYLRGRPNVAVTAPAVVDRAGCRQPSAWPLPTLGRDLVGAITLGRALGTQSQGSAPRRVGWAMGCALLVRRTAMVRVGGFDEGFFMYSEEVDLCTRLANLDLETHWVPGARVVHEGQASTGGHTAPRRAREMARSRTRYWQKHYGPAASTLARLTVAAQFGALAFVTARRRATARAFALQARETLAPTGLPGLREQAETWSPDAALTGIRAGRPDQDRADRERGAPAPPPPPT